MSTVHFDLGILSVDSIQLESCLTARQQARNGNALQEKTVGDWDKGWDETGKLDTERLWLVHEEKIKERGVKFRTKSINSQAAGVHISLSFPCVMFTRTLVYFL